MSILKTRARRAVENSWLPILMQNHCGGGSAESAASTVPKSPTHRTSRHMVPASQYLWDMVPASQYLWDMVPACQYLWDMVLALNKCKERTRLKVSTDGKCNTLTLISVDLTATTGFAAAGRLPAA